MDFTLYQKRYDTDAVKLYCSVNQNLTIFVFKESKLLFWIELNCNYILLVIVKEFYNRNIKNWYG